MRKLSFGLTIAMLIMAVIILPVGVSNIILALQLGLIFECVSSIFFLCLFIALPIDVVSLEDLHEDNYPVVEDEWMNHLLLQEDDFNFEQERLANAYAQLPLLRKQILKLLFVRDLKVKEIAKMLNCSPNFVSDQKRRALEALRRKLDEGGDENG